MGPQGALPAEGPAQAGRTLQPERLNPPRWGGTGIRRSRWTNRSRGPSSGWRTTQRNVSQAGGGVARGAPPCYQPPTYRYAFIQSLKQRSLRHALGNHGDESTLRKPSKPWVRFCYESTRGQQRTDLGVLNRLVLAPARAGPNRCRLAQQMGLVGRLGAPMACSKCLPAGQTSVLPATRAGGTD